jgi:hypothetical protein
VNDARGHFNLSELDKMSAFQRAMLANNMIQRIRNGTMPPPEYLILHPEARLSDAEKKELMEAIQKSLGQ